MKILLLAPFPPRMDAPHGGGRCVARLLLDLSARHRVGVIYFREYGEDPLDCLPVHIIGFQGLKFG